MYLLGHNLSVASGVGFIALGGVAAEFGVVMLLYLDHASNAGKPRADSSRTRTRYRRSRKGRCSACGRRQ